MGHVRVGVESRGSKEASQLIRSKKFPLPGALEIFEQGVLARCCTREIDAGDVCGRHFAGDVLRQIFAGDVCGRLLRETLVFLFVFGFSFRFLAVAYMFCLVGTG